jgi:hypothetical protein
VGSKRRGVVFGDRKVFCETIQQMRKDGGSAVVEGESLSIGAKIDQQG